MDNAHATKTLGVYIHVPFCLRKCPYCDFYSVPFSENWADAYTQSVTSAVHCQPFGMRQVDTLYFGGGTPVLLGTKRIARIISAISSAFHLDRDAEITVEANPAAAMDGDFVSLRSAGVNRLSLGVQSLQPEELASLGRLHGPDTAWEAIFAAASAGFRDISADVMLAIPGQTRESLSATIGALTALPVNHISAYLLKVEEGTPFAADKSALSLPDEDAAAGLYLDCIRQLEARGFYQYEISNFAREGRVSRHNLRYWQCGEYLGIGPAAHSFIKHRRFYFPRDLQGFLAAKNPFSLAVDDGEGGGLEERLLLGLRLTEGIDLSADWLPPEAVPPLLEKARFLESHGLVAQSMDSLLLTPQGFLLSNSVFGALLETL